MRYVLILIIGFCLCSSGEAATLAVTPGSGANINGVADGSSNFSPRVAVCDATNPDLCANVPDKGSYLQGTNTATTTGATTIIAAQGLGIKIYVTAVQCFRDDAGTSLVRATLNDSASTPVPVPQGGGSFPSFMVVPLVVAANTALQFTASTAITTMYCSAQGYKGP